MPAIGFGTFGSDQASAEQVAKAVCGAAMAGYRHSECAAAYGNEDQAGLKRIVSPHERIIARLVAAARLFPRVDHQNVDAHALHLGVHRARVRVLGSGTRALPADSNRDI
jgi:hypothetical protein